MDRGRVPDVNVLLNGAGDDLATFDIAEDTDPFEVLLTVGGTSLSVPNSSWVTVGTNSGGNTLRVAQVNLHGLGVAAGALLGSIVIASPNSSVEFAAAGALNSRSVAVAAPAPLALLGLGLLAAAGIAGRRRS